MKKTVTNQTQSGVDRRDFLKGTTAAVVTGSVAATLAGARAVHAGTDETLKYALIGCGGRGTGAAKNAANADPRNKLTVMCDVFQDRLDQSRAALEKQLGDQMAVDDDHCFIDFDGFKKVMETDVDVVLLCTSPHFRPQHLRAAIEAGKHVFCEKPVAVDGPGVRSVLETTKMAKDKGLCIVSGLCWRYDYRVVETMKRILDGAIGDIIATQENYLTGTLWHRGRKEMWSEMEFQMRNWLYFNWLSGDHITEQHIHSLDKSLWLNGDKPPVKCYGLGGRQVRTEKIYGNAYDHFATVYEWENGTKTFSYCRQQANCFSDVDDYILGTKGTARVLQWSITPKAGDPWTYQGPSPSMYDVEHVHLFEAIRNGNTINNGEYMSYSTLMALMGRDASYTGQEITSEALLNSDVKLGPEKYEWGDIETPGVAMPGQTA